MRTRSISNPTPGGLFKPKEVPSNLATIDSTILASSQLDASGSLNAIDPSGPGSVSSAGDVLTSINAPAKEKNLMGMRKRASSSTAGSSTKPDPSASLTAGTSIASISTSPSNGRPAPRGNKLFLHARSFYSGGGASSPTSDSGSSPGTPSSITSGIFGIAHNPGPRASQANSIQLQPRMSHVTSPAPNPRQLSLAEFKLLDVRPRRQRHVLHSLIVNDIKVRMEEKMDGVRDLKKPFKEPKFKEEKKGLGKLGGLLQKKKKKKTRAFLFHMISLAIHDQRTSQACIFLEDLSIATLRKKQPAQANRIFLSAMANSMESVCMVMLDKGFPISVNAPFLAGTGSNTTGTNPVVVPPTNKRLSHPGVSAMQVVGSNSSVAGGSSGSLGTKAVPMSTVDYPSYFIAAIGLGLDNVVRTMIKRSDVNQAWHGLCPIHIAASRNSVFLISLLIEHGADVNKGIYLSQYALLRRYKSYSPTSQSLQNSSISGPGGAGLRLSGLTGSPVIRQHPAGIEPDWSAADSLSTGSSAVPVPSVKDAATSASEKRDDIGEIKKPESPTSIDSSAKPSSVAARETISSRGSKGGGKLSRFSDEFLRGKKVFAVEIAAACGHVDTVKTLISRMDSKILASLSFALIVQRNVEMTVMFLRYGVPWNQRDQKGSTAIHLGARAGDLNHVIALHQCGADVNVKGENDWTPLHEAISHRRFDVASYLMRNGADCTLISSTGETPRDLGIRIGIPPFELDEHLSPNKPVLPAMADRELNVINQVKFIRFTTDHNGTRPAGVSRAGSNYSDGTSSPASSINGGGSTLAAPANGSSFTTSPSGGSPAPSSPNSNQRLSTTSNRNKFTAFLSSGRGERDRSTSSEADLRTVPADAGPSGAGKMKGFMGGRFIKRNE
ncbi:hypothetical protein HDU67_002771 [Dinochytrium kinnereticum]|nr:hypothetical protein HDU67_002771 [Dinochytrium kinnereticum]